ncbi:MAG: hypothetical protein V3V15_01320 [Sphingorhabdus sp.]
MTNYDGTMTADPLTTQDTSERVNYATGVLLQAEDFRDEQTYHRSNLARALRHMVGSGTLSGLAVRSPQAEDNELELRVEPGVALDRHGRLIGMNDAWCTRLSRWFASQSTSALRSAIQRKPRTPVNVAVVADLFLSAQDCARGKTPSIAQGPFDALDALVPARLAELPSFDLVLRAEGPPGPIPTPKNHWPAPNAPKAMKLAAVLGSWQSAERGSLNDALEPFAEHVDGNENSAVLLARVAVPVKLAANAPAEVRPTLDLSARVHVDNAIRPFIYLPGKWLGSAPQPTPVREP